MYERENHYIISLRMFDKFSLEAQHKIGFAPETLDTLL